VKLLRDTWLVYQRQMLLVLRSPGWIAIGLIQPVVYLLLFAPMLKAALGTATYSAAYRIYVPGLLAALAIFAGLFAGFNLLGELRTGVIERFRVTPVSRVALLLGRALRETTIMVVQGAVITVMALPFGLTANFGGLLLAYLLLAMMAMAATAISYGVTMSIKTDAALAPVMNTVSQPLALLSGVLLPVALAPHWLRSIADWNPFYWAVTGMRDLFAGDVGAGAVWGGIGLTAAVMVAAVAWTSRLFARRVS
jgi:ABC-2 type transport system permease protein